MVSSLFLFSIIVSSQLLIIESKESIKTYKLSDLFAGGIISPTNNVHGVEEEKIASQEIRNPKIIIGKEAQPLNGISISEDVKVSPSNNDNINQIRVHNTNVSIKNGNDKTLTTTPENLANPSDIGIKESSENSIKSANNNTSEVKGLKVMVNLMGRAMIKGEIKGKKDQLLLASDMSDESLDIITKQDSPKTESTESQALPQKSDKEDGIEIKESNDSPVIDFAETSSVDIRETEINKKIPIDTLSTISKTETPTENSEDQTPTHDNKGTDHLVSIFESLKNESTDSEASPQKSDKSRDTITIKENNDSSIIDFADTLSVDVLESPEILDVKSTENIIHSLNTDPIENPEDKIFTHDNEGSDHVINKLMPEDKTQMELIEKPKSIVPMTKSADDKIIKIENINNTSSFIDNSADNFQTQNSSTVIEKFNIQSNASELNETLNEIKDHNLQDFNFCDEEGCLPMIQDPSEEGQEGISQDLAKEDDDVVYNFLAVGDTGGKDRYPYTTDIARDVAKHMEVLARTYKTEYCLLVGDNFYESGVDSVSDSRFDTSFEDVYNGSLLDVTWLVIAGNHDHRGLVEAQIKYRSPNNDRWYFPHIYYVVPVEIPNPKFGNNITIDFIMIDTSVLKKKSSSKKGKGKYLTSSYKKKQWKWINNVLKESRADHIIVVGHHPVYSISKHGPTQCLVDELKPLLHKYNVSLYISGHDHNMQHLIDYDENGYVMNYALFGSGSRLYETYQQSDIDLYSKVKYAETVGGFGFIKVLSNKTLKVEFHNDQGLIPQIFMIDAPHHEYIDKLGYDAIDNE